MRYVATDSGPRNLCCSSPMLQLTSAAADHDDAAAAAANVPRSILRMEQVIEFNRDAKILTHLTSDPGQIEQAMAQVRTVCFHSVHSQRAFTACVLADHVRGINNTTPLSPPAVLLRRRNLHLRRSRCGDEGVASAHLVIRPDRGVRLPHCFRGHHRPRAHQVEHRHGKQPRVLASLHRKRGLCVLYISSMHRPATVVRCPVRPLQ